MITDDEVSRAFLLERFGDFLTLEQGAALRTTDAYARDVGRFVSYARAKGIREPLGASPRLLRDFVYHLKDVGLAPASIRRNVSAVRTYFRFLIAVGHLVSDPSELLDTPKRLLTLPHVLTRNEGQRLRS